MKKPLLLLALCVNGFFSYAYLQLTVPLLSDMIADLGLTNPTQINLIVTITSLAIVPAVLLCGKLTQTMNKRTLLAIGAIIFALGGVVMAMSTGIMGLLVARAIIGVGAGFGVLLVTGFLPDFYEGDSLSNTMGFVLAFAAAFGVLQALLAGFVGELGWRAASWLHLIALIPMVLTYLFIPKEPTVVVAQEAASGQSAPVKPIVYLYAFLGVIVWMSLMVLYSNVSIFIANENLGSTAQAGTATSLITAGGFVAGLVFGKVFNTLKKFTIHLYMLLIVLAFTAFYVAHSLSMVMVGSVLIGMTVGFLAPALLHSAVIASPLSQAPAQSIVLCGIYVGMFVSTFWGQLVTSIVGDSLRSTFLANIIFNVIVLAVAFVVAIIPRSNTVESGVLNH